MTLSECLGITKKRGLTAIVGGGGKTTLMYKLADEISAEGRSVLVSTTTKIMNPRGKYSVYYDTSKLSDGLSSGKVACLGIPASGGKLSNPGEEALKIAAGFCDRILVEADGAKGFPVKAPAAHEPVIPDWSDTVIAVSGLDAIGKPLNETCFRSELVCAMFGVSPDTVLTPDLLVQLILSENGQKKGLPETAFFSVLLNKADNENRILLGIEMAKRIRDMIPGTRVVITSLTDQDAVKAIMY